jgi:hypothetical protein
MSAPSLCRDLLRISTSRLGSDDPRRQLQAEMSRRRNRCNRRRRAAAHFDMRLLLWNRGRQIRPKISVIDADSY